jgi:hypothetical protein
MQNDKKSLSVVQNWSVTQLLCDDYAGVGFCFGQEKWSQTEWSEYYEENVVGGLSISSK